jgi:hypothetical protein
MTFMDDYHAGKTDGYGLKEHISNWFLCRLFDIHLGSLPEYLGMTEREYDQWKFTKQLPDRGAP